MCHRLLALLIEVNVEQNMKKLFDVLQVYDWGPGISSNHGAWCSSENQPRRGVLPGPRDIQGDGAPEVVTAF